MSADSVMSEREETVVSMTPGEGSPLLSPKEGHSEPHFGSAEVVRDIVIGLSDGLTVPFALAAGLATLDNSQLVVTAGMAGTDWTLLNLE